jgi:hypothetical protein
MLGLVLALPLACAPAAPTAADDPMNSKREVGALFATLAIEQPLATEGGVPMFAARLSAVLKRRFGLEASFGTVGLAGMREFGALGAIKIAGLPFLLKAGVSHVPGGGGGDHVRFAARTGAHVGASLLTGDGDDGVRWRFDWTHRVMRGYNGFSTLGVGLVLQFHPLDSKAR